jgi:hypothetical protein
LVINALVAVIVAICLGGCITTTMQGYADREPPKAPISRIVPYVAAPSQLAASLQSSITSEGKSRGVSAEDALTILPPTRNYTNAEIQKVFQSSGVDAVLIIKVGDTGVMRQYAGTYFQSQSSGSVSVDGTAMRVGNTSA